MIDTTELAPELFGPVTPIEPEVSNRRAVSNDAFGIIRQQYSGSDREPVSVSIETIVEADVWSLESHAL